MNIVKSTLVFKLVEDYYFGTPKISKEIKNFIADLSGSNLSVIENIKDKFITFDASVSKMNGSFVIVSEFSFDETLAIVPSLQEAYDYIEMEEMERQLKL